MTSQSKLPLQRFRIIAILEGISFLVLLGIAMPLKYYAGWPHAVKWVGWAHGLLFILYVLALAHAAWVYSWSLKKIFFAFVASLLPFATFYLEYKLKSEAKAIA